MTTGSERAPVAALLALVATGVGYVAAAMVEAGNRPFTANAGDTWENIAVGTFFFGLAALGTLLLAHRPRHRTGWLLVGFGLTLVGGLLAHAFAVRWLLVVDPALWVGKPAAWLSTWLITVAVGLMAFVPATWPTGRIEARWLRRFARGAVAALVALVLAQAIAPDSLDGVAAPARIDNPLGVPALAGVVGFTSGASVLVLTAFFVASVVDLGWRSIRRPGRDRALVLVLLALAGLVLLSALVGGLLGDVGWQILLVGGTLAMLIGLVVRARRRSAAAEAARVILVAEREDERRRLRAELHDGLGPLLAALGLELDAGGSRDRARALLDEAIRETRRVSRNLRPATLDELGLVGALRRQATALSDAGGPRIEVIAPTPLPALPASVEVAAFRIAGEAMTNAARHSGARHCQVCLDATAGFLHVDITDDGSGLHVGRPDGLGLQTMRDRADELGGHLSIGAGPNGGTRVLTALPISP